MLNKSNELPKPNSQGPISLEQAIRNRESVRSFIKQTLSLEQIGQLLWSGQGLRDALGQRTVPSAGALFPLELYLVIEEGVYHYVPDGHRIEPHVEGDMRSSLSSAALGQECVAQAPATLLLTAVFNRIETKYRPRFMLGL